MFKKIILLLVSLGLTILMSCDNKATSAEEMASKEVATEISGQALAFAGMAMGGGSPGATQSGISRAQTGSGSMSMDNSVAGLSGTGTYSYTLADDYSTYLYSIVLSMTYDNVKSTDGKWTMNGSMASTLDMEYIAQPFSVTIDGTLTGTINVSDGTDDYTFVFDLIQTQSMNADGTMTCLVKGTITSGSSIITVNESFSYTS